jgi:hypothetical protein
LSHRYVTFCNFSLNFRAILIISGKKHLHFRRLRAILHRVASFAFWLRAGVGRRGGGGLDFLGHRVYNYLL